MATYIFPVTHTTAPEIITVATAKTQLKLEADFTDDDTLIQSYINAAINRAERYTNTNIIERKFKITLPSFTEFLSIPVSPVQTVTAVKYYDENDAEQTLNTSKYDVLAADKYETQIHLNDFDNIPTVSSDKLNPVSVEITVGYASGKTPESIQQAILLMVTSFYEKRNDSVENLPKASTNLLRPFRFYN